MTSSLHGCLKTHIIYDEAVAWDELAQQVAARHLSTWDVWDQGPELARHVDIRLATDMAIYFCDPASPWQRGSNENTDGLLRQCFPKGTDLTQHHNKDLLAVAAELNGRPRKALGWATPAERLNELLLPTSGMAVATTT